MDVFFQVANSSDLSQGSAKYTQLDETGPHRGQYADNGYSSSAQYATSAIDPYVPPPNYVSPDAYPPPQEIKDSPTSDTVSIGKLITVSNSTGFKLIVSEWMFS